MAVRPDTPVAGVALAGLLEPFELTDPGLMWAALYGTCLAPVAAFLAHPRRAANIPDVPVPAA
ncbi:hypothetical protein [Nocardia sp. NPDC057272]|uniref:hypothetical protein n=1 Tax=Nocardia sp. NPDC057272 TaxID=3346079 RepID=UPI00362BDC28